MSCAHGAGLLGNAHPAIDAALQEAADLGYVNALETPCHEQLARLVCAHSPCADRVRFCTGLRRQNHLLFIHGQPIHRHRLCATADHKYGTEKRLN